MESKQKPKQKTRPATESAKVAAPVGLTETMTDSAVFEESVHQRAETITGVLAEILSRADTTFVRRQENGAVKI